MQPVATTFTLVSRRRRPCSSRRAMEFIERVDRQPRGWAEGYQPHGMQGNGCRGIKTT
jgi:hypothetical protein